MDKERFGKIIDNYIAKFDVINNETNEEYYKWAIAATFHNQMNEVLGLPAEQFADGLLKVQKSTSNFIDSQVQPFYGLVVFARKEPETVRQMFIDLFADDGGDLDKRFDKISNFLNQSEALKNKYIPDSFLYANNLHSVMGYLFLYDPDHNYMYKSDECREMANHVGFAGAWGYGSSHFKIKIFYLFCNQLMAEINNNPVLLQKDAERQKYSKKPLYPDSEHHILLFDIIYCAHYLNLYIGVEEEHFSSTEQKEYNEKHFKAEQYLKEFKKCQEEFDRAKAALDWANKSLKAGTEVNHITNKHGIVQDNNGTQITIKYDGGVVKKQGVAKLIGLNMLQPIDAPAFMTEVDEYRPLLQDYDKIRDNFKRAEARLIPLQEYLD